MKSDSVIGNWGLDSRQPFTPGIEGFGKQRKRLPPIPQRQPSRPDIEWFGNPHNTLALYAKTGCFLIPWRPNYREGKFWLHDPNGKILHIDHVGPDWMIDEKGKANELDKKSFEKLKVHFKVAFENISPGKISACGFINHQNEYQVGEGEYGRVVSS